jgi:hypothetical protein
MTILHDRNSCRVTWSPGLSEYKIEVDKAGDSIIAGYFQFCPILKQWALIISGGTSFTFGFTQNAWACLWEEREKIVEHASSPK